MGFCRLSYGWQVSIFGCLFRGSGVTLAAFYLYFQSAIYLGSISGGHIRTQQQNGSKNQRTIYNGQFSYIIRMEKYRILYKRMRNAKTSVSYTERYNIPCGKSGILYTGNFGIIYERRISYHGELFGIIYGRINQKSRILYHGIIYE